MASRTGVAGGASDDLPCDGGDAAGLSAGLRSTAPGPFRLAVRADSSDAHPSRSLDPSRQGVDATGIICRMSEENAMSFGEGNAACPFLAFDDDRDHRADYSDSRHRCYAAAEPEPLDCVAPGAVLPLGGLRRLPGLPRMGQRGSGRRRRRRSARTPPSGKASRKPGRRAGLPRQPAAPPRRRLHGSRPRRGPGFRAVGLRGRPQANSDSRRSHRPSRAPAFRAATTTPTSRRQVTKPDWENPPRYDELPAAAPPRRPEQQPAAAAGRRGRLGRHGRPDPGAALRSQGRRRGYAQPVADRPLHPSSIAPRSSPTPEPDRTFLVYRVRSGDTLNSIAVRNGITYEQIRAANPQITNPNHIQVGRVVYVPWQTWVIPSPTPSLTPTPEFTPTPVPTLN